MRRHVLASAVAAAALVGGLAGCAGGPDDAPAAGPAASAPATDEPGAPSAAPVAADLTVAVDATGEGATTSWSLRCGPAGGDHPDPDGACAALAAAGGAAAFDPPDRDLACTEQYGGPQTATVTGTVDGTPVRAAFSRTNGCEISRWDALEALLTSGAA